MPSVAAAVVLAAALALTGCDTGGGGGGGGGTGPAHLGETLTVSGARVRLDDGDRFVNFTGNLEIYRWSLEVEGGVENGLLSFTIGTPSSYVRGNIAQFLDWELDEWGFTYLATNNDSAEFFMLRGFETSPEGWLERANWTRTSYEWISYIWVSHAVTITGTGGTFDRECDCECEYWGDECDCEYWGDECWCAHRETLRNLNLVLAEGWNTVHFHTAGSPTVRTTTISAANPNRVGWVWEDYNYYYFSEELSGRLRARR